MIKIMSNHAFLKELIIENFMSYRYARIAFKPGLNLIIGPNGAGKSSILLALSIALGQTYTERSKKLSELIRWGEEYSRVTVRLSNKLENGRRYFPRVNRDEVVITRYLRKDGQYSFELNHRDASKAEILALLLEVGLNPDNPLIIMHQNMIENFGVFDPKQKLILFEEAVGLREYRERIIKAREKLKLLAEEEDKLRKILSETEGVLVKYQEQYERLLKKRELLKKRDFLHKELIWSRYYRLEEEYNNILNKISNLKEELEEAKKQVSVYRVKGMGFKKAVDEQFIKIKDFFEESIHISYLVGKGEIGEERLGMISDKLDDLLLKLNHIFSEYINCRVNEGILNYKITLLEKDLKVNERDLKRKEKEYLMLKEQAYNTSEPIQTNRSPAEIISDIKEVDGMLKLYRDVDDSIEETYNYYRSLHYDLKNKTEDLVRSRLEASKELEKRVGVWRKKIIEVISKVSEEYSRLLHGIEARGYARVINMDDVDQAGLELVVGFRGGEERVLDAYTQSGGERTTAVMLFLLALQGYVKSPLRAVDEFDVHMDPRNREVIMSYLIDIISKRGGQYLVITPGYISRVAEDANIIVVQKTGEYSLVKTVDVYEETK